MKYNNISEAEIDNLINDILKGNLDAFRELYDKFVTYVYNIAYKSIGDRSDSEDVTQEVFIKLYKGLSKFKRKSKFSTWLYSITLNVIRSHLKKKKRQIKKEENFIETKKAEIIDDINTNMQTGTIENKIADKQQIEALINKLPQKYKEVLILREYNQLSYNEISEICKLPLNTVKTRLREAKIKLFNIVNNINPKSCI